MERIEVYQDSGRYIARSSYAQKDRVKAAGFRWDGMRRQWYTTDKAVAEGLNDEDAAARAQAALEAKKALQAEAIDASRASDAAVELPCPDGLAYLPFQRAGIAYGLSHPNVLFGDEMGLGKTVQAIGIINADPSLKKILVVCPASLRLNWLREMNRWLVNRERTILIAEGSTCPTYADVLIINYDIMDKHAARLRAIQYDLIIADEAHYMKNPEAKRTIAVLGREKSKKHEAIEPLKARRKVFLTGTPIPNRPIEGFPLFHALCPAEFRSFWGYAHRYCDAHQNGYGWDLSGSSNLDELQMKLRANIMVRRLKADVLTELPAKRRCVIELPANGASGAIAAEQEAVSRHEEELEALRAAVELAKASEDKQEYADAVARLRKAARIAFDEMSRVRHDTAVAKIPYVVEHLRECTEGGRKVVCMAHHKDVVSGIMKEFPGAVKVTGEDSMQDRQRAVDAFQKDPKVLLFVGNIQAAGVGLTLTASSHVVFAELDWVPGNVSQAEDRCHRIGQRESVLVQHLVLEGSIDARMAVSLIEKQAVIDAALDDRKEEVAEAETVTPTARDRAATESLTRPAIDKTAPTITDDQREAIHRGLQILAAMDWDHARELNGVGYSRIDNEIGHSLAGCQRLTQRQAVLGMKLVNKYRRQLSPELVARAKGASHD